MAKDSIPQTQEEALKRLEEDPEYSFTREGNLPEGTPLNSDGLPIWEISDEKQLDWPRGFDSEEPAQ